ncbi:MAG: amidohydrolase family protein [Nitrospinota bacterium]|jgi:cytosine/adenosine deaminase-related metal-dependent hydrolase|nr:amidohydrolase family protein [Nitrospinota bacterium]
MSRILIRANRVLTLRDREDVIRKGAVTLSDGTIEAIGPHDLLSIRGPFDEELGSLERDVAMPGLVSAHHHAGNNMRDGLEDYPLEMWLPFIFGSYRVEMIEEETYVRSPWSALELQRCGVTTVVDFHASNPYLPRWGLPPCIQAYPDAGIRVTFGVGVRDQNLLIYGDHGPLLEALPEAQRKWALDHTAPPDHDEFFRVFDEFHGRESLARVSFSPMGPQTASDSLLKRIKERATAAGTGIQIHVVESRYQMMCGPRIYGKSLFAHLRDIGFLGPKVSIAHCVWPTEEDIDLLADTGTAVVHNPTQNFKLASGIAPVHTMREAGVRFAVGTDGSSFNDDNDIWTEMRLGWFLTRTPTIDWEPIPAREWVARCIQEGNRIAQNDNLGSLEEGKTTDIILLDGGRIYDHPDSHPDLDPWMLLLHRAQGSKDVHTILSAGKVVFRDGGNVRVDEEKIAGRLRGTLQRRYERLRKDESFLSRFATRSGGTFRRGRRRSTCPHPRFTGITGFEEGPNGIEPTFRIVSLGPTAGRRSGESVRFLRRRP